MASAPERTAFGRLKASLVLAIFLPCFAWAQEAQSPAPPAIHSETLSQTTTSWDGAAYKDYPATQPQLTVLKITIPPHTTMKWHTHPIPNAAYLLSGAVTVETRNGAVRHFVAGQVIPETVNTLHRGITGDEAAVLIVFYAGTPGTPLSQ
ncbi:MAG: cupin domain-containing protein [Ignavibacteriota bacterium]